jgi:polysaccharide pyruvyl transferase WcaK-like protein
MKRFRIVVRGAYGEGNFGDLALAAATAQTLRKSCRPDDFAFLLPAESKVGDLLPGARCVHKSLEEDVCCDLLLYGGGTQFFSFPLTCRKPDPLRKRLFRRLVGWLRAARRLKRPFRIRSARSAAIGIGCGPFVEGSPQQLAAERVFKGLDFVAVRDLDSAAQCRRWGIPSVCQGADLCYVPGLWRKPGGNSSQPRVKGKEKIGVIVRDWPHSAEGSAYSEPLLRLVTELRRRGLPADYILFWELDKVWQTRLRSAQEQPLIWRADGARGNTIESFLQRLAQFDLFITARYHGAVFGSLLGKPVLCVDLEPKLRGISEILGDGGSLWKQPFAIPAALRQISEMLETYPAKVEKLRTAVARQSSLASNMEAQFLAYLERPQRGEASTQHLEPGL